MIDDTNGEKNNKINAHKIGAELVCDEYNSIATEYQKATKRDLRNFTLEPTLVYYLGDLSGKRVLDLACGEGYSSRLCENLGAEEVVGIDVSQREIEMAEEIECVLTNKAHSEGKNRRRIEYIVGDVTGNLRDLNKFDVITAILLLHYCSSVEMLDTIVKNIKDHLVKNGTFMAVIPNPEISTNYNDYGVKMSSKTKKEGDPFITTLSDFQGEKYCSFTNYFWNITTYQKVFEENGFVLQWHYSIVSRAGIEKYGENFWKKFKEKPIYIIMIAKLK